MTSSVLITGAGSGIGQALAIEAVKRGYNVFVLGRRRGALEKTCTLAGIPNDNIIKADLTKASDRAWAKSQLPSKLDILINNAGALEVGKYDDLTDEAIAQILAINVAAPISLTRDLLTNLEEAKGRVVNVGSVFGDIGYPYFALYSATKFAVRGFSEALRRELHHRGVSVTYIAPRATQTEATSTFDHLIEPMQMNVDSAQKVAIDVWNGIEKGKRDVYAKGAERIFVWLQRLLPSLIDRNLRKLPLNPKISNIINIKGK